MKRKLLATFLCLVLAVSLLPTAALAVTQTVTLGDQSGRAVTGDGFGIVAFPVTLSDFAATPTIDNTDFSVTMYTDEGGTQNAQSASGKGFTMSYFITPLKLQLYSNHSDDVDGYASAGIYYFRLTVTVEDETATSDVKRLVVCENLESVECDIAGNKLTHTTANMEYSLDGTSWLACTAGETTTLSLSSGGTLTLRDKNDNTYTRDIPLVAAPGAPTLASRGTDHITLNTHAGCEYISTSSGVTDPTAAGLEWKSNPSFGCALAGHKYTFWQRVAAANGSPASAPSAGASFYTIPATPDAVSRADVIATDTSISINASKSNSKYEYAVTLATESSAPASGWVQGTGAQGGAITLSSSLSPSTAYQVWVRAKEYTDDQSVVCPASDAASTQVSTIPAADYTLYYSSTDGKLHINGLTGEAYTGNAVNWSGNGTTLTLNNFHFTTSAATALVLPANTALVLNGTSTVTSTYKGNSPSYGIYEDSSPVPLTVSGTGSLTATGGDSWQSVSYGLRVKSNGLTLTGGCTLSGISGAAMGVSVGIHANDITVTDSTLSGRGAWGGTSYGVSASGLATVNGTGVLTGTGGDVRASNESSYGVYLYGGVAVSGNGALTGTGGSAPYKTSCGVYGRGGSIEVTGGTLTATGGAARDASYGVMTENSCSITVTDGTFAATGGTLSATGGGAAGSSYGVSVKNGDIIASGGQFTAKTMSTEGTHQALSKALTLQNGVVAQGSAVSSGTDPVTYNPTSNSFYQWVQAAMPPTYTVTLGLTLDGAAYTGQTVAIQGGTGTSYPLAEGANGAYTNAAVPSGSYTIYKGGVSTGETVTVSNANSSAALEFFTVSFDANGGAPAPAAQVVLKNGYAAAPAAMTKGTDIFGGWYADPALSSAWTFDASPVTGATTLYAKWTSAADFRPVREISDVLGRVAKSVDVTLTATVDPGFATNKTIVWSVKNAGTTGASIAESGGVYTLRATATGTLTVTATIANGLASGPYTQDFDIVVVDSPAYTMDFTLTNATWGNLNGVDLTTTDAQGAGWSWASQSKTLTLNSLRFTTVADTAIRLPSGTMLVLNGTSAVTSTYSGGGEETYGIECEGDLTISGGGTLNATGGVSPRKNSHGALIYGLLTVNSGTLNAKGGGGDNSFGAEIGDSITMNSGTLTCTGGTGDVDVIGIKMGEGGTGTLTMNGGTLNATAGISVSRCESAGLMIFGDIIMNAGVINAVGATSGLDAYGIHIRDFGSTSSDITISGGTLNAKGGSGALSKAPMTIANVIARASRDMSGSAPETYDSTKNREYKWFSAAPPPVAVAFTGLTANGSDTGTTTLLYLFFDKAVDGFSLDDIEVRGAKKGQLAQVNPAENIYELTITDITVADGGTVNVAVAKDGFTFTPANKDVAVRNHTVTTAPSLSAPETVYRAIEGAGGTWAQGSPRAYSFTFNAPLNKFRSVRADGSTIAASSYTTASGSTIIALKPEYLATLSVGTHTIRAIFSDGYAQTTFTITEAANPFTDVSESDWFYDDVRYVYENGLFKGVSDTAFSPAAPMTRAMLVTVLWRLEKEPVVNYLSLLLHLRLRGGRNSGRGFFKLHEFYGSGRIFL